MKRKPTKTSLKIDYRTHRLVNKKSGKLASSTSWLIDLAACSLALGTSGGIASLLPLKKAAKLMLNNELRPVRRQKSHKEVNYTAISRTELRNLAQKAMPVIAVYYTVRAIPNRHPSSVNRKGFVAWIVREMANPNSGLNKHLIKSADFAGLAETKRSDRWWLDQIRMQSK